MGLGLLFRKAPAPSAAPALKALQPLTAGAAGLQNELKDCLADLRRNQMLFDLELEPELIDQRIYEYQAIQSRYRYLQRQARAAELRAIL